MAFLITFGEAGYQELYQWNNTYDPRIGFTFGVHPEGKIIPPNLQISCYPTDKGAFSFSTDYYLLYDGGKIYIPKLNLLQEKIIALTHVWLKQTNKLTKTKPNKKNAYNSKSSEHFND